MANNKQVPISIRLSPTQVDEVVRAASRGRAPSISTLVAHALTAPSTSEERTPSPADDSDTALAADEANGTPIAASSLPVDSTDPRLSRSLLRGLSLLTCFGSDGAERGIVELAHDAGMSPSTAHRYATTLVAFGLLERCPVSRKYRLPGI